MNLSKLRTFLAIVVLLLLVGSLQVHAANKDIVGVGSITTNLPHAAPDTFRTMLETALARTNKFDLIERSRLDELLGERKLGETGVTDLDPNLGKISGVDYLVYGTITKLGITEKSSTLPIPGMTSKSKTYEMMVDLRLVNVATGKVILANNVGVDSKSEGQFNFGQLFGNSPTSTSSTEGDPMGDIQRLAAIEIAGVITLTIRPIKVVTAQSDGTVILNYGGVVLGNEDYLRLYEVGEGFVDPDTGEILGVEEIQIGILKVSEVLEKFTKSRLVSGTMPAAGMIARIVDESELKALKKEIRAAAKREKKKRG